MTRYSWLINGHRRKNALNSICSLIVLNQLFISQDLITALLAFLTHSLDYWNGSLRVESLPVLSFPCNFFSAIVPNNYVARERWICMSYEAIKCNNWWQILFSSPELCSHGMAVAYRSATVTKNPRADLYIRNQSISNVCFQNFVLMVCYTHPLKPEDMTFRKHERECKL